MTNSYAELRAKVEKYFDLKSHLYTKAKHSECCGVCFLEVDHPIHIEE